MFISCHLCQSRQNNQSTNHCVNTTKRSSFGTHVFERNPSNSSCSPCASSNTDLNNYVYSQENMHESVMTFVATGEFSVESVHITNFMQKYI